MGLQTPTTQYCYIMTVSDLLEQPCNKSPNINKLGADNSFQTNSVNRNAIKCKILALISTLGEKFRCYVCACVTFTLFCEGCLIHLMTLDVSHNQLELIPQGMFEILQKGFNVSCAIVRMAHLVV